MDDSITDTVRSDLTRQNEQIIIICWRCGVSFAIYSGGRWRVQLPTWPHAAALPVCSCCDDLLTTSEVERANFAIQLGRLPGYPSKSGWFMEQGNE